jgi:excisionase family DNA binding protein
MNAPEQALQWADLPLVLTTAEVAETLRLHPRAIAKLLAAKRLHGIKTGRDWRISRTEVMRFMGVVEDGVEQPEATPAAAAWEHDPLAKLVGAFAGGPADLSSRHREYYADALEANCRHASS